jgi:hypothetical protein
VQAPLERSDLDPARTDGRRAGATAQIARFRAILADERSKGRERFCITLACRAPEMKAEDILDLAADVPSKDEAGRAAWRKVTERINARSKKETT